MVFSLCLCNTNVKPAIKRNDKQEFDRGVIGVKKLLAFVFSLVCVLGLFGCNSESASVGIIGGADGPTAILLTYSIIKWMYVSGFIGIVVAAVLVALFFYCKKKKK